MKRLLARLQLGLILSIVLPISVFTQNADSVEFYSTRPRILATNALAHPELGETWLRHASAVRHRILAAQRELSLHM